MLSNNPVLQVPNKFQEFSLEESDWCQIPHSHAKPEGEKKSELKRIDEKDMDSKEREEPWFMV